MLESWIPAILLLKSNSTLLVNNLFSTPLESKYHHIQLKPSIQIPKALTREFPFSNSTTLREQLVRLFLLLPSVYSLIQYFFRATYAGLPSRTDAYVSMLTVYDEAWKMDICNAINWKLGLRGGR